MTEEVKDRLLGWIDYARECYRCDNTDMDESVYIADILLKSDLFISQWVRTSDRLPKAEDGTECGCVIGYDSNTNCVIECYVESVVNNPERITWWQPFPGLPKEA